MALTNFPIIHDDYQKSVENLIQEFNNQKFIKVNTSGSTGAPKIIKISKQQIKASCQATIDFFNLNSDAHLLLCMGINYIGGKMMLFRAIHLNAKITCIPPRKSIFEDFEYPDEYDFAAMVPTQIQHLVEYYPQQFKHFKTILLGGAPIEESLEQKIQQHHDNVFHAFGMTETVSHFAIRKLGSPIYQTLPGVTIEQDQEGQMQVLAPQLTNEAKTSTNDIINKIDKKHFTWLGRSDFVINSGGHKIHPEKIEQQLAAYFHQPIMITAKKSEKWGEEVVLLIEKSQEKWPDQSIWSAVLHPYEKPQKLKEVSQLYFKDNGKIDRIKNQQAYAGNV